MSKFHCNYEENTYRGYTKENEKGKKHFTTKNSLKYKGGPQERKGATKELQYRKQLINGNSKSSLSIITLPINGLNSLIKDVEWLNK